MIRGITNREIVHCLITNEINVLSDTRVRWEITISRNQVVLNACYFFRLHLRHSITRFFLRKIHLIHSWDNSLRVRRKNLCFARGYARWNENSRTNACYLKSTRLQFILACFLYRLYCVNNHFVFIRREISYVSFSPFIRCTFDSTRPDIKIWPEFGQTFISQNLRFCRLNITVV